MNDSKISVRYTKALFQSALGKKILDRINQDMKMVSEICALPEVMALLESPIVVPSEKSAVMHKVVENNLDKLTVTFIDMVIRNGRGNYLPAIARNFTHETLKYNGFTETVLTTPVTVDGKIKKQISDLVADVFKTKADLKEVVDSNIIGGFMLRVGDNYIDASVRTKLRKIEKELKIRNV